MGPRFPTISFLLVAVMVLVVGTMITQPEKGIALAPTVEFAPLDLALSTPPEFTPGTAPEVCTIPAELLAGPLAAPEEIDEGGCVVCLACVVAAGYCIVSGGWSCVAALPPHLWTGVLAGCVGACGSCVSGPPE